MEAGGKGYSGCLGSSEIRLRSWLKLSNQVAAFSLNHGKVTNFFKISSSVCLVHITSISTSENKITILKLMSARANPLQQTQNSQFLKKKKISENWTVLSFHSNPNRKKTDILFQESVDFSSSCLLKQWSPSAPIWGSGCLAQQVVRPLPCADKWGWTCSRRISFDISDHFGF